MMQNAHVSALSVVDADGYLKGIITRESISDVIMIKTLRPDWPLGRVRRV
jgi:predicted transcriptional regulator